MGEIQERERTPNPLLKRHREMRGWSRGHMAKELQTRFPEVAVTDHDIARWERGTRRPGPYYREKLCVLFQTTADKLGFIPQDVFFEQNGEKEEKERETTPSQTCQTETPHDKMASSDPHQTFGDIEGSALLQPCHTEMTRDILESADSHHSDIQESDKGLSLMDKLRRAITNAVGATLVGVNLDEISASLISSEGKSGPTVPPEEYIPQCTLIIESCWEWRSQGDYTKLATALQRTLPTLRRFANIPGPYQSIAANLAMQASILQISRATKNMDFIARETYGIEAVKFGKLSGDPNLHVTALGWYGNTYTLCYRRPQNALKIFRKILPRLNSDTPQQTRSAIYSDLAVAHAQDGNEKEARDYIEMAHRAMPSHPELDPINRCAQWNHQALNDFVGKAYLHLAEHFHNDDYAQQANKAYEQATSSQATHPTAQCLSLIRKADAARVLGDRREFVECLTDGLAIGIEVNSMRGFLEAQDVLLRVPDEWKKDTNVQDLQKDISQVIKERSSPLVIARR